MSGQAKKITVTAIENDSGVITAFFDKLPGLVVQGNSLDDVQYKLAALMDDYIQRLKSLDRNFDIKLVDV